MGFITPSFASPLGFINLGEQSRELNKELIAEIDYHLNFDDVQDKHVLRSFWNTGDHKSQQSDPGLETEYNSFKMLQHVLTKVVQESMIEVGFNREFSSLVHTRGFWANVTENGGISLPHIHLMAGKALFSGVYYPQGFEEENQDLDDFVQSEWVKSHHRHFENSEGCLVIESNSMHFEDLNWHPAKLSRDRDVLVKPEVYNSRLFVKPRQGLLVLFPATQPHYTLPCTAKRYSISFSTEIRIDREQNI